MKSGLWALLVIVEACSQHFAYLSGHGTEVDRGGYSTPAVWTSINGTVFLGLQMCGSPIAYQWAPMSSFTKLLFPLGCYLE